MSTRDIRTSQIETACDVCGRTLLRGEHSEVYLEGLERRVVCELCKPRALHEGWVREGTVPAFDGAASRASRRGSLLGRLRGRGERLAKSSRRPSLSDDLDGQAWVERGAELPELPREPRHVHAIPTSVAQKQAAAVELFNASEHRRTVAGVARTLGSPLVSVRASPTRASAVDIAVGWELCWYRYEVDLADDEPVVRQAGQGAELHELSPAEREANAAADEDGWLSLASA